MGDCAKKVEDHRSLLDEWVYVRESFSGGAERVCFEKSVSA